MMNKSYFCRSSKANCRLARIVNDYLVGWDFSCSFTGWACVALIARANPDTGGTLLHFENSHKSSIVSSGGRKSLVLNTPESGRATRVDGFARSKFRATQGVCNFGQRIATHGDIL